ncbi:hypothetical protein AB0950_04790 [Streptomyces sp. NPDC007189]|uniref:hypothetical protein n=1 Tax=Streptomyces sp. NPDC007189 TaxID=3154315 RepID=UPI0034571B15
MPSRRTIIGLLAMFAVVFGAAAWYIETQVNASPKPVRERTQVEVTQYGVDQSHGRRMAVAEYVIHNDTAPGPVTYTVTFGFGDDPAAFTKTVVKRVDAHDSYTGSVSMPWDQLEALDGVRVLGVQRD